MNSRPEGSRASVICFITSRDMLLFSSPMKAKHRDVCSTDLRRLRCVGRCFTRRSRFSPGDSARRSFSMARAMEDVESLVKTLSSLSNKTRISLVIPRSRSTMLVESCTSIGLAVILLGSLGNWLCICVFLRKRFRSSVLTPFFVALLIADCIYLTFRVVKLLYYQETLFQQFLFGSSCSRSILIRLYGHMTQYAPQILIPLCHYELYIRFSLLLMSFLAVQRAYDMCWSSFRLIQRSSSTRSLSFVLIVSAFLLAYVFEFVGLSIFCSRELSPQVALQWAKYLFENLPNETHHLTDFMKNQSAKQSDIDCLVERWSSCSSESVARK